MTWVLIVILGAGYTSGGFSVDFKTKEACELVRKDILDFRVVPLARCYAK